MRATIAVVPGSGEGRSALAEISQEVRALDDVIDVRTVELGVAAYRRTGVPLPAEELATLRASDAIVIAAPPVPGADDADIAPGVLEHGIVFALRRSLRLSINLRVFTGTGDLQGTEIAVVRENSEGAYFQPGELIRGGTPSEEAVQTVIVSRAAVERCVRFGFAEAQRRGRDLVVAHKARVLTASGGIWVRVAQRVAQEYPQVSWRVESIDTCCGRVVADPTAYGVIVTDNVFGDIIADVCSAATRAGDHAVSVEYSDATGVPSIFEPMHDTPSGAAERVMPRALGLRAALGAALVHVGQVERGESLRSAVRADVERRPTAHG